VTPTDAARADEELLAPTLGHRRAAPTGSDRPWRLGSQVYVAFFGGAIAVTPIAIMNGLKLGIRRDRLVLMALAGILGLVGTLVLAATWGDRSGLSAIVRLPALAAWGVMWAVQRVPDRAYVQWTPEEDEYASLVGPGIALTVVGLVVQSLLVAGAAGE